MSICKEKNGTGNENAGAAEYKNIIAVTNRKLCERPFPEQVERICQMHPKALILREKDLSESAYEQEWRDRFLRSVADMTHHVCSIAL